MEKFKIEIINPEEVKELFKHWGQFACKCYDTPLKYAERVGKSCLETGHFSGSRSRYIEIDVSNVPRDMIDQIIRREQGLVKNVQSARYCDFSKFDYYTPKVIAKIPEAKELYDAHMIRTRNTYSELSNILAKNGITGEKNYEACRGVSPMSYRSGMVIGITIEALIEVCHKRLCVRSQEHSRYFIKMVKDAVLEIIPELKPYLVPSCEYLLWCPEGKRCCGKFPTKEGLLELIQKGKGNT